MIVFPDWWHREQNERLERYYADQRARRLADLRQRLLMPVPSFMRPPGTRSCWQDKDVAVVQRHVENVAALLKLTKMDRADYPNADALRVAIIRTAPLLDAGPGALGTLSLPLLLFVGVVEAFDRQRANTGPEENA